MTSQVKGITLRATYESNLSGFKDDLAAIKSFRRQLEKTPIKVAIRLDMSSIKSDAAKAAAVYKKHLASAFAGGLSPGSAVSKGGIIIPAGAASEMKAFAATSTGAFKEVRKENGELIQSFEQLERGIQRVTSKSKTGKTVRLFDSRPLASFQKSLDEIERSFSGKLGSAKGNKGDVAALLAEKRDRIAEVLSGANLKKSLKGNDLKAAQQELDAVRNTPLFQKAEKSLDRLEERIAATQGAQNQAATKQSRGLRIDSLKDGLLGIDNATASKLGSAAGNKGDVAGVLASKRQLIADELAKFSDVADSPAFKSAQKSLATLDKQIAQAVPSQQRATDKATQNSRIGALKDSLLGIENATASNLGSAKGNKGDVASVLSGQRNRIANELANFQDIKDTPAFKAAGKAVINLDKQIAQAAAGQQNRATKESRGGRITSLKDSLLGIDTATASKIGSAKGNKGDVAAALADKRNQIARELARFSDIADSNEFKSAQKAINTLDKAISQTAPAQQRGKENDARKDFNRRTNAFRDRQDRGLQTQLKANKTEESNALRIDNVAARERDVNRVLDERKALLDAQVAQYRKLEQIATKRGQKESATVYRNAGNTVENQANQLTLDRRRSSNRGVRDESDAQLKQRLTDTLRDHALQRERLKTEETLARKIANRTQKEAALKKVLAERQALEARTAAAVSGIGNEAGNRGLRGLRDQAAGNLGTLERQGIADMRKLTTATNSSGHAINFHTSSLLKNAATFTKWYVPAQLAMGAFRVFGQGAKGAVDAQRTFKILNAVFRGSAEDAALLADETLQLSAANGRSTAEAAEAAVAWARLGFTRTQVLVAMETSLRAANVAEISAAEATAYLTANYKAFGQTIAEIPATLDYINSLSNKNPVAPKEIFEGLSRSAATAKVAGLAFEDLAAIITTVSATTQRPGQEVGNSINTVLTRLRRPTVSGQLKAEFGIDISDAEGDAKKMIDVLNELSILYPTLNRLEKARLGDVVAGARQGNRFTIVMENWNDSLLANAQASLDVNSAQRENARILDSVSAKVEKLSTTWTRLFHTIGESGAFDWLAHALNDAGLLVDMMSRLFNTGQQSGATPAARDRLSGMERTIAAWAEGGARLANGQFESPYTTARTMSDSDVSRAAGVLKKSSFFGGVGDSIEAKVLNDGSSILDKDNAAKAAARAVEARKGIDAKQSIAQFFENISNSFGSKGSDPVKILSQLELAITELQQIEGADEIAKFVSNSVQPLVRDGKVEDARKQLAETSQSIRDLSEAKYGEYSKQLSLDTIEVSDSLDSLKEKLSSLREKIGETDDKDTQKNLQDGILATQNAIQETTDKLATLKKEWSITAVDPFTEEMNERLKRFVNETKLAGEVYGGLLESFGNTGFAGLDASLKAGGASLQRNILGGYLDAASSDDTRLLEKEDTEIARLNSLRGAGLDRSIDDAIEEIEKERTKRKTLISGIEGAYNDTENPVKEALALIDKQRQTAILQSRYDDARASTGSGISRYEIGRSEGSRLTARTRGAITELTADVNNPALGAGGAVQDAQELGGLTERLTQSKQGLASMEDRMNRALAERVNLEGDITEENRKQNEEASRALALASRGDQLRSAAAAAVLRSRGKDSFSLDEFQFFSQETRSAISNYSPRSVKGLDQTEADQNESRSKLDREISGLAISLRGMRQQFEELLPAAQRKGGGIIDLNNPLGGKPPNGAEIINLDKNEVRMNLNMGAINIDLDFSKHVQAIKDAIQIPFDAKMEAVLTSVRNMLLGAEGPDTSAAGAAW